MLMFRKQAHAQLLFKDEEKEDGQRLKRRDEHNIATLFKGQ